MAGSSTDVPHVRRQVPTIVALFGALVAACGAPPPEARTFRLTGLVLGVNADREQLTVRHDDIDGYMPGMVMSFPVAETSLLVGREPGELIEATLEVTNAIGRLTAVTRTGFRELPAEANLVAAGPPLEPGEEVPDTAFIDQQDRRRLLSEWHGRVTLLTFIYTRCPLPNFCPLMDRHYQRIQETILREGALADRVRLISISFDPEHDTPTVLAAHAAQLGANPDVWTFLTADRATIDRFAGRLGVGLIRPPDSTEITHNLRTVLMGADGRVARVYSGNEWTPAQALTDLRAEAGRRP
jgi:protein SCO1/2